VREHQSRHSANRWGFWLFVTDDESARDAIKLIGMPMMLLTAAAATSFLSNFDKSFTAYTVILLGILAIGRWIHTPIAAGNGAPVFPLAFLISVIAASICTWAAFRLAASNTLTLYFLLPMSLIIGVGCLVSIYCSVRGWLWLQRAGKS